MSKFNVSAKKKKWKNSAGTQTGYREGHTDMHPGAVSSITLEIVDA
jgi:hypothetical protein